ncbi:hypothetical protein EV195_1069 [Tenacibaculum skagerrakense]|uniref:Uncharacterized protein n=1 Tax=Tenacibaculum skagerrakense TaxID=186571 RepID=A0A4R2NR79_9FLAO|nr:hypothetical protein [Tenacibaculum skagerrakense]TCP24212.1 hypothetical protein EV195_1069 [Tenacibaculum skagerrakense]
MKLLKIVLIALVTVGIYSFKITPHNNELIEQTSLNTTCITITYKSGLDNISKERTRDCFAAYHGITFFSLIHSSGDTETWTLTTLIPSGGKDVKVENDDDDHCPRKAEIIAFSYGNDCINP